MQRDNELLPCPDCFGYGVIHDEDGISAGEQICCRCNGTGIEK